MSSRRVRAGPLGWTRPMVTTALAWTALLASSCASASSPPPTTVTGDDAVTVASFAFPESEILAELYGQALEGAGIRVERAHGLGPRELVEPALEKGLIELIPEYLGSALSFLEGGSGRRLADPPEGYRRLAAAFRPRGVEALEPAPAQDANGVAVTAETAARYGLETISDLDPVAGELLFGGPPECPERPHCLPGLESLYGLRFDRFVPLDASGPLTAEALERGEVDVAVVFTTSGYLASGDLVLLDDDRGLQPAENVVPVIRADTLRRLGGALPAAIDAVSRRLTTAHLIELNRLVDLEGRSPADVARAWLGEQGIVP